MDVIFQKEFSNNLDSVGEEISKISIELGFGFYPVVVKPFEHTIVGEIPEPKSSCFLYGSNIMSEVGDKYAFNNPGIIECISDEESTNDLFGDYYINHDMRYVSNISYRDEMPGILEDMQSDYFFIKPRDEKYFAGTICDFKMMPFVIESQGNHHGTPYEYLICVSPIKMIAAEWRLIVVDGKVVTGSKYHGPEMRLEIEAGHPEHVNDFAYDMLKMGCPGKAYALDIAEMMDGELKIVEINSINSSGFYECDKRKYSLRF